MILFFSRYNHETPSKAKPRRQTIFLHESCNTTSLWCRVNNWRLTATINDLLRTLLPLLAKGSLPRALSQPGEPVSSSPGGLVLPALPPSSQLLDIWGHPLWFQAFKTCLIFTSNLQTWWSESLAVKTIHFILGPSLWVVEQERQSQGVVNPKLRLAWADDAARVHIWL